MKLVAKKFKHTTEGFTLEVTTCNSRIATTRNVDTDEIIKFNRPKFEWMINKKIFQEVEQGEEK